MKSESFENKNKLHKISKKIKTIKTKLYHSNSFKKRRNFNNCINRYNVILTNSKRDENNNSYILNTLKNNSIPNNKNSNSKQIKLVINKKLKIKKKMNENTNIISKNLNCNINKKNFQRNNKNTNKQLIENNKSYMHDEKKKTNIEKIAKNDDKTIFKKSTLQDENKSDKLNSNLKLTTNKTGNFNFLMYNKNKKNKVHNKNNQINNNIANREKIKKILNMKKNNNNHNQDDIFIYDKNKAITLTTEELSIYGDRAMKGYHKIKILGKGGYGVVWLCKKIVNDVNDENKYMDYAVKQTSKKNFSAHNKEDVLQIAKNEIEILAKLNQNDYGNKKCDLIPKIYESYEDNNDIWFSFEKGGLSLSALTFNIKGIFEKGERLYHIQKGEFLLLLFKNIKQFKLLLRKVVEGIDYINKRGIIHSDIKPENILVQYSKKNDILEISSIKIVDYGSAFYHNNQSPLLSNTPEYLCPEIITNNKEFIKELNNGKYLNAIDIWSAGISILELCLCCPIWMSYKTKIFINGKINNNIGYFGCKGRDGNKIYQKQIELSHNLNKILKNSMIYMFDNKNKDFFIDLLSKMLNFNYAKRITTEEALNHPFLN